MITADFCWCLNSSVLSRRAFKAHLLNSSSFAAADISVRSLLPLGTLEINNNVLNLNHSVKASINGAQLFLTVKTAIFILQM